MVYSLRDLLRECAAGDSGNLEDYATVWRASMRIAEDVLSRGRGIVIPNLGRITLVKNSLREGPGLKHRVFLLSDHFQRLYGVWFRKPGAGLLQTCTGFNYAKLCVLTSLDTDSARTILATLIQALGQAVSRGCRVRVTMGKLGVLTADDRRLHISLLQDGTAAPQGTSHGTGGLQIDAGTSKMYTQPPQNGRRVSRAEVPQLASSSKPVNEHSTHCNNEGTQTSPTDAQPTNTTTREQPCGSTKEATCHTRQRSSSYRNNCRNNAVESHIRHLPNGIDVNLDMKPTSIFPTDVKMTRMRCYAAPTKRAVEPGLQRTAIDEAYHRLEKRVARQMAEEERMRQSIQQREESMDAKYANDRAQKKQRQVEWRKFLVKQVNELRERHEKEEEEKHKPPAPDGQDIKAYPLGTKFDRMKRQEVVRSIRETLEGQIHAKESAKRQAKQRELDQDKLLIDWVRYTDEQERNNRLARKIIERETLLHDWGLQRAHAEETKKLRTAKLT